MKTAILVMLLCATTAFGQATKIREGSQTTGALPTAQGGVPTGGSTNQGLKKNSASDYDYSWGAFGTVTNTGGNLTSNAIVLGAGTTDTKVVAGITTDGATQLNLGTNGGSSGKIKLFGGTSGDVSLQVQAAAGTGATATFPNTNTVIPAFSQQITFNGPTTSRTVTLPDANFTVARTDAANTFTGHQTVEGVTSTGATGTGKFVFDTSPTLVTPLLGTPTSGTLTNCTGLPTAGLVSGAVTYAKIQAVSANAVLLGSSATGSGAPPSEISLGTALSMSGSTLNCTSDVNSTNTLTLTNKRITKRVLDVNVPSSPVTPDSDSYDGIIYRAIGAALTLNAPSGTPTSMQPFMFRFKDDGTGRALTFTTGSNGFRAITVAFPTTTVANKTTYLLCIWNGTDSRWDSLATGTEP